MHRAGALEAVTVPTAMYSQEIDFTGSSTGSQAQVGIASTKIPVSKTFIHFPTEQDCKRRCYSAPPRIRAAVAKANGSHDEGGLQCSMTTEERRQDQLDDHNAGLSPPEQRFQANQGLLQQPGSLPTPSQVVAGAACASSGQSSCPSAQGAQKEQAFPCVIWGTSQLGYNGQIVLVLALRTRDGNKRALAAIPSAEGKVLEITADVLRRLPRADRLPEATYYAFRTSEDERETKGRMFRKAQTGEEEEQGQTHGTLLLEALGGLHTQEVDRSRVCDLGCPEERKAAEREWVTSLNSRKGKLHQIKQEWRQRMLEASFGENHEGDCRDGTIDRADALSIPVFDHTVVTSWSFRQARGEETWDGLSQASTDIPTDSECELLL